MNVSSFALGTLWITQLSFLGPLHDIPPPPPTAMVGVVEQEREVWDLNTEQRCQLRRNKLVYALREDRERRGLMYSDQVSIRVMDFPQQQGDCPQFANVTTYKSTIHWADT